jgi:transcriptional regulator with XRE-family HTH domain
MAVARGIQPSPLGRLLREWRARRGASQLHLAIEAGVSPRHLSFVETGRAQPSREMVLRLADRLEVPLRERNRLLTAAGYAPLYGERRLDDPTMKVARQAVDLVLRAHEPSPALVVDRHWTMVASNRIVPLLLAGLPEALLAPPVNVLRLSLHPQGLAPRIVNLAQWRAHLFHRLRQQIAASGDEALAALADELHALPGPAEAAAEQIHVDVGVYVPLQLQSPLGVLSFISTITVFGTPTDITLSELALESFLPADEATANALRTIAAAAP